MAEMRVDAWNIDVGVTAKDADDYGNQLLNCVEGSWDDGADVVLLPEYCWLGAEPYTQNVEEWFWKVFWPAERSRVLRPGKAVVLGTVPFAKNNRAVITAESRELHQDKLALTPWESNFTGGTELNIWKLGDVTLAVLVCLDIEIPEWSCLLRGANVDVLLVPSATETLMGVERIARCASARAVELGCAVVTAHLVGKCQSELIDHNIGRSALYLPSLAATHRAARVSESNVIEQGMVCQKLEIDIQRVRRCKISTGETNPALFGPARGLPSPVLTLNP